MRAQMNAVPGMTTTHEDGPDHHHGQHADDHEERGLRLHPALQQDLWRIALQHADALGGDRVPKSTMVWMAEAMKKPFQPLPEENQGAAPVATPIDTTVVAPATVAQASLDEPNRKELTTMGATQH
jgi:hypothetical protein